MAGDPTGSQQLLTVITEAGAAAQTPFPYSILRSEIRLQNQFLVIFDVRRAFLRNFWGPGGPSQVDIVTSKFLKANARNSVEPLLQKRPQRQVFHHG